MLIRLVRMTFHRDRVDTFLTRFDDVAPRIRATDGCTHLELWQDAHHPNILTTYSTWESDEALQAYRESELFRATWSAVKPHFAARPQAHSYRRPPRR